MNYAISFAIYLFIKTSFAWVTKLSVNTVFQFGPGLKHNTVHQQIVQYIKNIQIASTEETKFRQIKRTRPARRILNIQKLKKKQRRIILHYKQ